MRLSRRAAGFLLAVAAWNVVTYANFIRNLAGTEGRPVGFYIAHAVLIVVNLAIAAVLAVMGWRAWRAAERTTRDEAHRPGDGGRMRT